MTGMLLHILKSEITRNLCRLRIPENHPGHLSFFNNKILNIFYLKKGIIFILF